MLNKLISRILEPRRHRTTKHVRSGTVIHIDSLSCPPYMGQ